jgi:tyrosinase
MTVRRNHSDLTPQAKSQFVQAVLALKNDVDSVLHPGKQGRYDDFVEVHKNAMTGPAMFMPMPHGTPLFYPWHRVLLRQFELALQAAVNDQSLALPYWNWQRTGSFDPFTDDFLGGNGDLSDGGHVVTGPFAFSTGKFPVRVWDGDSGDPALRRDLGEDATAYLPTDAETTSALGKSPYSPGPSSWEKVSEAALHNPVHNWVGGNMADATSPNDPVFFLHHAFIDLLWERWKVQHPSQATYLPGAGVKDFGVDAILVFNAPTEPAPWNGQWTVMQTIKTADLGYTYA